MVRALGVGFGVNTQGYCIQQAWQCLPTVGKVMKPCTARTPRRSSYVTTIDSRMRVTASLPNFSPAKILEHIIFTTRFKKADDSKGVVNPPVGETGNGSAKENQDTLDGQNATESDEQEKLIGKVQEETRRVGLLEPETLPEGEEIASVTKDDRNPSILWERREKDVIAEEKRTFSSPGFSFSAAGLLFPYHLGVCQCLLENGYITENTPLAGSSAGAIVCAVVGGGLSMHEALYATKELAQDCRAYGTAFRLGAVLRGFLERFLPDNLHEKVNGRIRVAVTQVFRKPRGLLVDDFDSKEDLINALLTSSFIPGYLAPRPATIFRNRICVDGGITMFMPPTAAEKTVRICAFPSYAGPDDISPDLRPAEGRATARQLFSWALEPAEDVILDELFELGFQDALVWVNQQDSSRTSNGATNGATNGAASSPLSVGQTPPTKN